MAGHGTHAHAAVSAAVRGQDQEVAPPEDRLARLENIVRVQATHHEHLAQQIAELTVAMHEMRNEVPKMVAEGFIMAVGDPRAWEAGRAAMKTRADQAVAGAFWAAWSAVWDKVKWLLLLVVLLWALRGPQVLADVARLLWRGPGA